MMKINHSRRIKKVLKWIEEVSLYGDPSMFIHVVEDSKNEIRVKMYTTNYEYCIVARDYKGSYLGCVLNCRKSIPGETWRRGSDLPDGKISRKTWNNIKNSIIGHELKVLFKKDV